MHDATAHGTFHDSATGHDAYRDDVPGSGEQRSKSLLAFLKSIRFLNGAHGTASSDVEQGFAQPRPRARQRRALAEESHCIRSAN